MVVTLLRIPEVGTVGRVLVSSRQGGPFVFHGALHSLADGCSASRKKISFCLFYRTTLRESGGRCILGYLSASSYVIVTCGYYNTGNYATNF